MRYERCRQCREEVIWWAFFVNIAQTIFKALMGLMSGSAGLLADALHSGADVVASAVTMFSIKMSSRPRDEEHPYGYGNIQYISSSIVGLILFFGSLFLIYESVVRISAGDVSAPSLVAAFAAALTIIVNELMFRYQNCVGTENKSPAIIANAWDNRSDAMSSVAVLVGIIFAVFGFPVADSLAAIGVGVLVAKIGIELNIEAVRGLMDSSVEIDVLKDVYAVVESTPEVEGVCYLRGRNVGEEIHLDVNVYLDSNMKVHQSDRIIEAVRQRIFTEIEHVRDVIIAVTPVKVPKGRRRAPIVVLAD